MGRKDKKKDDDISNGDAVLGALGLALPDVGKPVAGRPAPAPAPAPQGDVSLSFDIGAGSAAPRPAIAPRPAPATTPVARDSLLLAFGEPAPAPAPAPAPRPAPATARAAAPAPAPTPYAARPAVAAPAPAPVQAAPKPAPARRLAALPALPKFVSPDEIKIELGFDAPPVEGKGKIKQITWNLKATDQASNIINRQSRTLNLSPLMAEALDQAKSLRDTIKQHKDGPAPASSPAPQPRSAPAPSQPRPAPSPPRPAPATVAQPAPKPAVAQQAPRPAPKPAPRPAPAPAPAPEPLPDLEEIPEQQPQPQARSRPQIQIEPAAANVPERDIIATPVKTMGGDVLQAQQPIEKHAWQEAKAVMAPSATSRFTAVAQQSFTESPAATGPAHQQQRVAPVRQAPTPEPAIEEVQTAAQARGGRSCAKCGGSNFREDDDKSKPLSFTPPFLYAKKFVCKNCGTVHGAEAQAAAAPAPQQAPRATRPSQIAQQQAPAQARRVVQTSWEETSQQVRPSAVAAREEAPTYGAAAGYEETAPTEEQAIRAVCPNCGGTSFNVVQDKTRPISFGMGGMGAVYAKVKQCRKCGAKFD